MWEYTKIVYVILLLKKLWSIYFVENIGIIK